MPVFFQQDINPGAKLALWRIEEAPEFFLERVPVPVFHQSPQKRLQHLAGRYLLQYLQPGFPLGCILVSMAGRPYLEHSDIDFSISHTGHTAAAIISLKGCASIDVEEIRPRIGRIMPRFLHPEERSWVERHVPPTFLEPATGLAPWWLPTLLWSAKETVFKAQAAGAVSFQRHIRFEPFYLQPTGEMTFCFCKDEPISYQVGYRCWDNLCLTWLVSDAVRKR